MLHSEMVQRSLQVMQRHVFDKDNTLGIPSASLEDMFQEMDESFGVKMKWLTVNTDVVGFQHEAKTELEKTAVKSLAAGKSLAGSK